jgi:hypothetical protein
LRPPFFGSGRVSDFSGVDRVISTKSATDESALPAGAKAPLKSGKNPKGYEVQGLESGTYLVEGDAAYDVSGGDFWFKSTEDAEAAGLTRADEKESDK